MNIFNKGRRTMLAFLASSLLVLFAANAARADDGWRGNLHGYSLPPVYSQHGESVDTLFNVILWITMIALIGVQLLLLIFVIKYRHSDKRRAHFTHGNARLEMAWTIAPSVILAVLALWSKDIWARYRYAADDPNANPAQVLAVAERFNWNFVFPGPDNKLGRYVIFPKTTDPPFRTMSSEEAIKGIDDYIAQDNPLGQVSGDWQAGDPIPGQPGKTYLFPGKRHPYYQHDDHDKDVVDDDYLPNGVRPLIVPVDRMTNVVLTAKDVIHDFFLPNFRVKLDAVPGMRGMVPFTPIPGSESVTRFDIASVPADAPLWLNQDSAKACKLVFFGSSDYAITDPIDPLHRQMGGSGSDSLFDAARNHYANRAGALILDKVEAAKLSFSQRVSGRLVRGTAVVNAATKAFNADGSPMQMSALKAGTKAKPVFVWVDLAPDGKAAAVHIVAEPREMQPKDVTSEQAEPVVAELRQGLAAAGLVQAWAVTRPYEIVCEELCGEGHGTMRGVMFVLPQDLYGMFINRFADQPK